MFIDGKLMFILMDTESSHVKSELRLKLVEPIASVHDFLKQRDVLGILSDHLLHTATSVVENSIGRKSPDEVEKESSDKATAAAKLLDKYSSGTQIIKSLISI
jgi:Protein of unknown function (DUF2009)